MIQTTILYNSSVTYNLIPQIFFPKLKPLKDCDIMNIFVVKSLFTHTNNIYYWSNQKKTSWKFTLSFLSNFVWHIHSLCMAVNIINKWMESQWVCLSPVLANLFMVKFVEVILEISNKKPKLQLRYIIFHLETLLLN